MSSPSTIRVECDGAVRIIAFNRPERRNAWNVACARETIAAIGAANDDPDAGAIVLTGEGSSYSAGADLRDEPQYDPGTGRRLLPVTFMMGTGEANWITLIARSKPVVAAINGPAVGLGATHVLAADIRVMAESAHLSFPFLGLGAMPECGSTALLARLVGAGRARDILLRSATVSARQALDWGLVTHVFADSELRAGAIAIARELAEVPRLQMALTRRMLDANIGSTDADAIMQVESRAFVEMLKAVNREKPLD